MIQHYLLKDNAESIKGVVGENLRNSLADLERNVELVSLKYDVELGVDFDSLLQLNPDQEKLDELFAELEFKALPKNTSKQPDVKETLKEKNNNYETVLSKDQLKAWAKNLDECKVYAIDTETDSLDTITANLVGISLSVKEGAGCYIPIGHTYEGCSDQLSLDLIIKIIGLSLIHI